MLSIIMTITAIAKNILLTANNLFPNTDGEMFHQIFPFYDETTVRAFIFSNFIPIVRTCILCFGPVYGFIELNYWGAQADWSDAPSYIQRFGKIFPHANNRIHKILICGFSSVVLFGIIPFGLFSLVKALDVDNIFSFNDTFQGFGDGYFYFGPLLTEIVVSYFLSRYSVEQIAGYLGPSPTLTNASPNVEKKKSFVSKVGLFCLRFVGIYYLFKILLSFYKMLKVFGNYTIEEIVSTETIFGLLLNYFPDNSALQTLDNIFLIFPIDFLLVWLLGFIFALQYLFTRVVGKDSAPKPRNLFFLCFIICGFISLLAYQFIVYYPWMYATSITGSIYEFTLVTAKKYYPKIIAEKIFSFYFVLQFLYFQSKRKVPSA